jgi:glycosyltransferase involved in cell wall biosynthesis
VVTIHDIIHLLYPEFLPSRLAFLYAQRMIRRALVRGTRIIAVSQNTKTDLMDYFEVDGGKIQVVYNGVEEVYRQRLPAAELERWQRQLGLAPPYLLFVGNPKPHKNLENVLRAYARAQALQPFDARLVCVGSRDPARDFKLGLLAEQLGVAGRVQMLGHVAAEALPAVYQGADLFLYPTLYEGFGLPVVEAMAAGVPVLTSSNSALRELAEGYALLVDPLDVEEMAQGILRCVTDADYRDSLAKLGTRRAADFRWDRTAEKTREVYLGALRAKAAPKTAPKAAR